VTEISAALVKELRDLTGAGMMDCKRALQDANGDLEAARTLLRERGMASAAKRADRATSEGKVGYRVADDLASHPGVTFHRVPKVAGSYFLSQPLMNRLGRRWARAIAASDGCVRVLRYTLPGRLSTQVSDLLTVINILDMTLTASRAS